VPGEKMACEFYYEVYAALRDSDCSPYSVSNY
jgi:hypothetical protein